MRAVAILGVLTACAYDPVEVEEPVDEPVVEPLVFPAAEREPVQLATTPPAWQFAVLSDLHLPNPRSQVIDREVQALIRMGVRFVVITGDFTNGAPLVDHRQRKVDAWWSSVTDVLQPLRDAGIAVLPVAGNHDTYLAWQREGYERAFADVASWAAPLEVHAATGHGYARAPYSYSVDVEGLHLALANITDQDVDRDVAAWLTEDLAAASAAKTRIVFGHVPLYSIVRTPPRRFVAKLGGIFERGNVSMYVAGHEHLSWDETFGTLRQVMVGCASGYYVFAPSAAARARAGCDAAGNCTMPNGGSFELVRDRGGRRIEHDAATFTVFTVTDGDVEATPMTVGADGEARAFYLLGSR